MTKKPKTAFNPTLAKRPQFGSYPEVRKIPAISVTPPSHNDEHPSWRIARLEFVDPFGWHEVTTSTIHDIRKKLSNLESMTWNDILIRAKKQNHSVPLNRLCKKAQIRLSEMKLDSLEELVSLRLSGEERVWGYRIGPVLHVLWWDPHHEVCPSLLKHT